MKKNWNTENITIACNGEWFLEPEFKFNFNGVCSYLPALNDKQFVIIRGDSPESRGIPYKLFNKISNKVAGVISDDISILNKIKSVPSILVENNKTALLNLGKYARNQYMGKVIAITGSAGKTTTTSMLESVLSEYGSVEGSRFSANLPYGVAWNLASFNWDNDFNIVELAVGSMRTSSSLAKPDVCIFTNILPAHLGKSSTIKDIANAKSHIFFGMNDDGIAILNQDMEEFELVKNKAIDKNIKTYTYGSCKSSDAVLVSYNHDTGEVLCKVFHKEYSYILKAKGYHIAINSIAILLTIALLELDIKYFLKRIANFEALEGRGKVYDLVFNNNNITIIDDAYNANPGSMKAAIKSFIKSRCKGRKGLVLGEMADLGQDSKIYHHDILELIDSFKFDFVYTLGSLWREAALLRSTKNYNVINFKDINSCEEKLQASLQDNDCILFKGSNSTGIHKIVKKFKDE